MIFLLQFPTIMPFFLSRTIQVDSVIDDPSLNDEENETIEENDTKPFDTVSLSDFNEAENSSEVNSTDLSLEWEEEKTEKIIKDLSMENEKTKLMNQLVKQIAKIRILNEQLKNEFKNSELENNGQIVNQPTNSINA